MNRIFNIQKGFLHLNEKIWRHEQTNSKQLVLLNLDSNSPKMVLITDFETFLTNVYKATDIKTGEEVALKIESNKTKHPQILYEAKLLRLLRGSKSTILSL